MDVVRRCQKFECFRVGGFRGGLWNEQKGKKHLWKVRGNMETV